MLDDGVVARGVGTLEQLLELAAVDLQRLVGPRLRQPRREHAPLRVVAALLLRSRERFIELVVVQQRLDELRCAEPRERRLAQPGKRVARGLLEQPVRGAGRHGGDPSLRERDRVVAGPVSQVVADELVADRLVSGRRERGDPALERGDRLALAARVGERARDQHVAARLGEVVREHAHEAIDVAACPRDLLHQERGLELPRHPALEAVIGTRPARRDRCEERGVVLLERVETLVSEHVRVARGRLEEPLPVARPHHREHALDERSRGRPRCPAGVEMHPLEPIDRPADPAARVVDVADRGVEARHRVLGELDRGGARAGTQHLLDQLDRVVDILRVGGHVASPDHPADTQLRRQLLLQRAHVDGLRERGRCDLEAAVDPRIAGSERQQLLRELLLRERLDVALDRIRPARAGFPPVRGEHERDGVLADVLRLGGRARAVGP